MTASTGRWVRIWGAAFLVLLGGGCNEVDDRAGDLAGSEPLVTASSGGDSVQAECETQGYPCTWEEVEIGVGRRIAEMSDRAVALMHDESPTALLSWLATVPDVAGTGVDGDSVAVWFRLEGGRPVYVLAPHSHGSLAEVEAAGVVPAPSPSMPPATPTQAGLGSSLLGLITRVVEVTGRDRNNDAQINQRDGRRALVLDPLYFEFCYEAIETALPDDQTRISMRAAITAACDGTSSPGTQGISPPNPYVNGDQVAREIRRIPAFTEVTLLKDTAANHQTISTWGQYDVIHLATHGSEQIWALGGHAPLPRGDIWPRPPAAGLYMAIAKAGDFGPTQYVWAVDLTYVRQALGSGLDRTFVFADACKTGGVGGTTAPPLAQFLTGTNSGILGWTSPVGWGDSQFLSRELFELLGRGWTVPEALDSLRLKRTAHLFGPVDGPGTQRHVAVEHLAYRGKELRLFEIPVLVDPQASVPGRAGGAVVDGDPIAPLVAGALGDGQNDELTVDVEVRAITDIQAPATMVHLELDGTPIGPRQALDPNTLVGPNRYRLRFQRAPVGEDLQIDTDYELEAVVDLPEGGESRYIARLRSENCVVPTQGDFFGALSGPRSRRIDRLGREGYAKINPSPVGGDWWLKMENLVAPTGQDLVLSILFDGTPTIGGTVQVTGTGYADLKFAGGVDDGDQHASWYKGDARITFTDVVPQPGKDFVWVCGDITADVIGAQNPPPGAYTPIDVPGRFVGSFMAEWYPNG